LTWHDPKLGRGSVFFEKLLAGLGGQADTFPIFPDGHRGDGIITVDEIATYLREEVSLSTNQEQIPIPADLALNRSLGGFFFLNRQKMVANGLAPAWNPNRSTPFGARVEETLISAKQYYAASQYDQALPLLRKAAEAGNGEAAFYLGSMYQEGKGGLPKPTKPRDFEQAANWYRKAADAGEARGMTRLGTLYMFGDGVEGNDPDGVNINIAQAKIWFQKGSDAGDTLSMVFLGALYAHDVTDGMTGIEINARVPKNDVLAVSWYRKAAELGDRIGMLRLAGMYENGQGGLPKDLAHTMRPRHGRRERGWQTFETKGSRTRRDVEPGSRREAGRQRNSSYVGHDLWS
jgi:hypothetical protein